jgi:hypothetical protein
MRVQVDDARHQGQAAGIDHLGGILAEIADRGDAAVFHPDIGPDRVVPEPVDHGCATDHQVMHRRLLRLSGLGGSPSIIDMRLVLCRLAVGYHDRGAAFPERAIAASR